MIEEKDKPDKEKDELSEEEYAEGEKSLWEKGGFVQSVSSDEINAKMSTFHKRHDEDMNFDCKECNKNISGHNKDRHDNMCDECFNKKYYGEVGEEHLDNEEEMEDELDSVEQEAIETANEMFDEEIWHEIKEEMKDLSRRDACRYMFSLGFLSYFRIMDEKAGEFEKMAKTNPKEFNEAIQKFKEEVEK